KEKNIVDSFLRPKQYIGKKIQDVIEQKATQNIETVADYLRKTKHFSKEISNHICHVLELDCKIKLSELTVNQKETLESKCNEIAKLLINSKTFYVYFLNDKYFIAPFKIPELESLNTMASVSQALYYCFGRTLKYNSAKEKFKQVAKELKSKQEYLSKELEWVQKSLDFEQRIKQYEEYARLLLSQPNVHSKGMDSIEVTTENGNRIEIPLKKDLTLIQNAEAYYQKIKKLKADIITLKGKRLNLEEKIKRINSALESLNKIDNYLLIDKFLSENRDLFPRSEKTKINQEIPQNFRRFEISPDAVLFVGKNARNNEELTFNFARPNDYWFHTRTASGSHCVLRMSG
ncbi:MAG: NFACT family protein, partial [Candidatus Kapaibacteriota bacterium]